VISTWTRPLKGLCLDSDEPEYEIRWEALRGGHAIEGSDVIERITGHPGNAERVQRVMSSSRLRSFSAAGEGADSARPWR